MDLNGLQDDLGGGKKMGLARLAKARRLSNSINSLQYIDDNTDERVTLTSPTQSPTSPPTLATSPSNDSLRSQTQDPPVEGQGSPLRSLNRQGAGAVNLLPNKMDVLSLSGKSKGAHPDEDGAPHAQVPCSDPDFLRGGKSGSKGGSPPQPVRMGKVESPASGDSPGKKSESSSTSSGFYSPMLSRRNHLLEPPKVKRSSSLTRLTEAINQIHNICVFPGHPAIASEHDSVRETITTPTHKTAALRLSAPEVIGAIALSPLVPTQTRSNREISSPRLSRRSAFRETVLNKRHPSAYSLDAVLPQSTTFPDDGTDMHSLTFLPPLATPDGSTNSSIENGLDASDLPGTKTQPSPPTSDDPNLDRRCSERRRSKKGKQKATTNSEVNRPDGLKHVSTAPTSLSSQENGQLNRPVLVKEMRSGRPVMWDAYKHPSEDHVTSSTLKRREHKDEDDKDSSHLDFRSASLDEISNIGLPMGLPILSPGDLKHKNYLFGGFSSLLGASELDRYIPKRSITIFIATWNMNGKEPQQNLEDFLLPEAMDQVPDMYVVGTQESGGSRSEWEIRLQTAIGPSHVLFTSAIFGVLHLIIFLRRDLLWFCSVPEEATYSLRPGVAYKTKGGVGIGFQFFGTRMLFINSHLTAHEEKQSYRIQNFKNICHSLDIPRLIPLKLKNKDVTHRYDCVFWLGDLNFRLAVNRDHVFDRLKSPTTETFQHLMQWDQLTQARKKGEAFTEFEEAPITFAPTFKYDPGTDHYDTSSKQRVPSYTDRILYKSSRDSISCTNYNSCPFFRTSDHKPVSGVFHCKIRPGKDDVPLAAGMFNRDVYLEALRRRRRFLYQPSMRNCPVQ